MSLMLLGGDGHFKTFSVVMLVLAHRYHALVFLVFLQLLWSLQRKYLFRHESTRIVRCTRDLLINQTQCDSYRTHLPAISWIASYKSMKVVLWSIINVHLYGWPRTRALSRSACDFLPRECLGRTVRCNVMSFTITTQHVIEFICAFMSKQVTLKQRYTPKHINECLLPW